MDRIARIKTASPVPYKLIQIEPDTHDTKTFRFELPADATLDMLPGDFLYVHATLNGKTVKRAYTPSSLPGVTGYFDLTVKRYETGLVSRYLHEQRIGDTVLMSGPNAGGHWVDGMAKQIGFVAGGTGITPMISIIRWILANRIDAELFLIFANKTEADIIFRQEWERAVREHPNFHCHHLLENPPTEWTQGTGRVTPDVLRRHLPPPGPDTCIFLCGPPPMVDAVEAMLLELGYSQQAIILP
ncbi:cytochrome b5 reductase family protein [Candidatus Nitrospira inopinata]|jgi:cytochrome-b5 reductase|uniref:Putative Cytochrome-b5 reductase n=1 Tax=Candidatus Nitrospira inopinata TaxID=1715989 RepID=A0A0S4KV26_9BACT|nr:NADH-cytochrome b5 reductase [Candidatus Nitrospira inopinata]CUQ67193.1 putative Cytochrome-b5 reductase [Candidatus Nitrospira inopinata]